jgi:hypothetical protein
MHKEWNEVCSSMHGDYSKTIYGEHKLTDGRVYAIYGTAHGDGTYSSPKGSIDVDSGTIGCILVTDIQEDLPKDGFITVTFDYPFDTGSEDGVIFFGHIFIDTDLEYEKEDDFYFNDMFEDELDEDYFGNTYEDDEE